MSQVKDNSIKTDGDKAEKQTTSQIQQAQEVFNASKAQAANESSAIFRLVENAVSDAENRAAMAIRQAERQAVADMRSGINQTPANNYNVLKQAREQAIQEIKQAEEIIARKKRQQNAAELRAYANKHGG